MAQRNVLNRADELLALARHLKRSGMTWVEANNAIFGPGGRFVKLFVTKSDRLAFAATEQSRKIDDLIDSLREPELRSVQDECSGKFMVRVPKSLHAALSAEAQTEGVNLNQLVVAKLSMQLAEVAR